MFCVHGECSRVTDIGELQRELKAKGVQLLTEAGESKPASFFLMNPDGDPIVADQHV